MISMAVMTILTAVILTFCKDSFRASVTAYEMTEAQESLRTAQEYITRDLMSAGDGLRGLNNICLRGAFVTGYLAAAPANSACGAGLINLPMLQSDDDVPDDLAVLGSDPPVTVRTDPSPTDRMTLLQVDSDFTPVTVAANTIATATGIVPVPAADIGRFNVGEIYFITSSAGSTFARVTQRDVNLRRLTFGNGDGLGLNLIGNGGPLGIISDRGALPASIMRMRLVHYFVDENGLLVRRTFGVRGAGFTDSVIAEHVRDLQFRYVLNLTGPNGLFHQPVSELANPDQQAAVRQVEVTITTETAHPLAHGSTQPVTMTTTTGVRNFQFLEALQP
jgi:hypothetical protein